MCTGNDTKEIYSPIIFKNKPTATNTCLSPKAEIIQLTTIAHRCRVVDMITIFNILNRNIELDSLPLNRSSYRNNRLILPFIKTSLYRSSFFHRSIVLWNRLSSRLQYSNLDSFKHSLDALRLE